MRLESLRSFELRIPFNTVFKHASPERAATQTIWIQVQSRGGITGFGEGCPREYVTGESLQTARKFVAAHLGEWLVMEWDLATLIHWTERCREEIDTNPAAWCAVELALLDLLGKTQMRSVESLLNLPEPAGSRTYTAVLGNSAPAQFTKQLSYYLKAGFRQFKFKLAGDPARDRAAVSAFLAAGVRPEAVRADANNFWPDSTTAIREVRALGFPFFALEEPLPVGDFDGMRAITRELGTKIILDESVIRADQLAGLGADAERWILNVRVSKMGGLLRTLEFLREARRHNLSVVVGAHVGESSLLTRAAFTTATAAGNSLVAQEGAFGTHLLARDVIAEPLMFGAGGALDLDALRLSRAPGFGLEMAPELPLHDSENE